MDVVVPQLAEGAETATVVTILVKAGASVAKDQPIAELETAKAIGQIPAPAAGKVEKIYVKVGDELSVGQKILSLSGEKGEENVIASPLRRAKQSQKVNNEIASSLRDAPRNDKSHSDEGSGTLISPRKASPLGYLPQIGFPAPAAPSVRRMAQDSGIDLAQVRGSERGGRITLGDLRNYVQQLQKGAFESGNDDISQQSQIPSGPAPQAPPIDFSKWGKVTRQPLTPLRRTVSQRMSDSWATIPHVTQFDEVDLAAILTLRKKQEAEFKKKGVHLTLTPFLLTALVKTLKKFPVFNSSLEPDGKNLVLKHYINLGIAVDTGEGLIVPVIKNADKKSLFDLAKELEELALKARKRKVNAEELDGGTFTVSNQGGIGGGHFTPIIYKPQVAILGVGRARKKPVIIGEKMEIRMMLPVTLSYDHRVIDGADAARFMVYLAGEIERGGRRGKD